MVNSDRVLPWLGATIVVRPASVGSQSPQPHLEDGSVYRQNRPAPRSSNSLWESRCRGSQAPQPHLEDGTVYRQLRPTTLDSNCRTEPHSAASANGKTGRSHTLVELRLGEGLFRSHCGNKCGNSKQSCLCLYGDTTPLSSTIFFLRCSHGYSFQFALRLSLEPHQSRRRSLLLAGAAGAGSPGGCVATVTGGGGCFGIGFIAGLAHFSYNSKNFVAEGKQPPVVMGRVRTILETDCAGEEQLGAKV